MVDVRLIFGIATYKAFLSHAPIIFHISRGERLVVSFVYALE
jgi:hypothetical protein